MQQKSRTRAEADVFNLCCQIENNSACDLKIVKCLAAGHDSAGDASDIAKGRFVMADLVAHIEPEGEPLSEEVLQATPKFPVKAVWWRSGPVSNKFELN